MGLTAAKIAEFTTLVTNYCESLTNTDIIVKQRKADRSELIALLSENSSILALQFNPYITFDQEAHPALYREYIIARRSTYAKRKVIETEILTDISGMVTESNTGAPVANATAMITELTQVVTTDEDRYYLFDEVPAGTFTLTCHAKGYKLPANVTVTVTDTQSLQVNFELQPEVVEQPE